LIFKYFCGKARVQKMWFLIKLLGGEGINQASIMGFTENVNFFP